MTAWPTATEMALEKLAGKWTAAYVVTSEGGGFHAEYRYGDGTLKADTLEGLDSAIRAHWAQTWSTT